MGIASTNIVPIGNTSKQVAINWNVNVTASDDAAKTNPLSFMQQGTPGLAYQFSGWKFSLSPLTAQGVYSFGDLRMLRISVMQPVPWFASDASKYYVPGRILINIPSSGEVFIFTPKMSTIILPAGLLFTFVNTLWSTDNLLSKVSGKNPAVIDVYMEADASSAGGGSVKPSLSSVAITAYNFDFDEMGNTKQ